MTSPEELRRGVLDDRLELPAGTVLVGSYRIMRVVGSGGFGITYEAEDTGLGAVVAIRSTIPSTSATATPP